MAGGVVFATITFVSWFGPPGLATVVFALIALESLELTDSGQQVLATVALVVPTGLAAHGLTAGRPWRSMSSRAFTLSG
jgi:sodium/hydrogen antiporter